MRSEFQTSSTIANARAALQDQAVVVHGGGFTIEGQELDRRRLLSEQLKLARQLRGVMERAAETAKTLSPNQAREFYLELEPEICQLVSLTKAVRGEYTLENYHQYDIDNQHVQTQGQSVHSISNNAALEAAKSIIKEHLQDMAYERNPSLFPERKSLRNSIISSTKNQNGRSLPNKKKGRIPKTLQKEPSVDRRQHDINNDISIAMPHNFVQDETSNTPNNNINETKLKRKLLDQEMKVETIDTKEISSVSSPNFIDNNAASSTKNRKKSPGDQSGNIAGDTSATPKLKMHRINRRKTMNKSSEKASTKKGKTNNSSPTSKNMQYRKQKIEPKSKESTPQSNNARRNSLKVSSEKSPTPSVSSVKEKKNATETPNSNKKIKLINPSELCVVLPENDSKKDLVLSTPVATPKKDLTPSNQSKNMSSPTNSELSLGKKRKLSLGESKKEKKSSAKSKRKTQNQGRKCHQCKVNGNEYRLCHFWFVNGTKCRKTYCKDCLVNIYKMSEDFSTIVSDSEWHCPACLGTCTCPTCVKHRQRAEIKLAKRPSRASAGFYSFT